MRNSKTNDNTVKKTNLDSSGSTKVKTFPEIPGYKIVRKIGKGSHGLVFKAIDKRSNREVAIKTLKPSLQEDEELLRRFRRELRVLSRLSHRYIIKIYAVGKTGNPYYIAMEYIRRSLRDLLRDNGGKLPKKDALQITRRLAKALHYAHRKGVIHRDIKPANILFRSNGQPVLADFGLVKILSSKQDDTKPQTSVGTPVYMSPEQYRAEKVDHRSDIYSLGVVLFEMLSGELPLNRKSNHELLGRHTDSFIIPELPSYAKDCQPLINLMMAKDKDSRISALQVRKMIEQILSGKKKWPKRMWVYSMAVLIIFLVIIMVLILLLG